METLRQTVERHLLLSTLLVSIGVAALSGCGEAQEAKEEPNLLPNYPGTVVGREYDDSDVIEWVINKTIFQYPDPEHFYLEIRQCDRTGDAGADANGCVTLPREVDQTTYDSHPDGSSITFNEES